MVGAPLRIATRGSDLALWQAHAVRDALRERTPGQEITVEIVHTLGDRILDVPLARIGDRGLFTKELDAALLSGRADIAVHSLKDVPTRLPPGLTIAAVTEREDPRDVLLLPHGAAGRLRSLPAGSRVGTSSLRRRAQLLATRPDLVVLDLRGNLNTRLNKLDDGGYDAIILAAAGVRRLGWDERVAERLDPSAWLPAVGQGALAVVARADDPRVHSALAPLAHADTVAAVAAERSFLGALEGGCQIPIGALARTDGSTLQLDGLVASVDGVRTLREQLTGPVAEAERIGLALADRLVQRGASEILAEIRGASALPPAAP